MMMKTINKSETSSRDQAPALRVALARRIASFIGSKEKLITDIPGLLLSRRTAPTAPASATYEPSLAVVAQGRKRADLAGNTFIFDESRYLLTSLDLPAVRELLSQFNREYSRFFGQPPMRHIRTLRSPGPLPLESVSNRQSAM
jgi:AraC-type transcriptional regulator N-terminus